MKANYSASVLAVFPVAWKTAKMGISTTLMDDIIRLRAFGSSFDSIAKGWKENNMTR